MEDPEPTQGGKQHEPSISYFLFPFLFMTIIVFWAAETNTIMQRVKLMLCGSKLWIRFSTNKNHAVYQCPLVKNGKPCLISPRSDRIMERHICSFQSQRTITSYIKKSATPTETEPKPNLLQNHPLNDEQQLHRKLLLTMLRCNMSFRSICSPHFKELLKLLTGGTMASPLLSLLNYKTLAKSIAMLGNEMKLRAVSQITNKTVTLMLDGGKIGRNHCTAVTIRPHSAICSPIFWDLAPGCWTEEDYSKLANYYISELDQYQVHVFAFCTDGLSSQKGALTKPEKLKQSSSVAFMNPLWIYCSNHLTNLVVHDATTKDSFLQKLRELAIRIANEARTSKNMETLGFVCPSFVMTRWLALQNICICIRNHSQALHARGILTKMERYFVLALEILLTPLINLQKELEANDTVLHDCFFLLKKTIWHYILIANHEAASHGPILHSIRVILTFLYQRFFLQGWGSLYALAYCFTPEGFFQYNYHHFSWTIFDCPLFKDIVPPEEIPTRKKKPAYHGGGILSFATVTHSFVELNSQSEPEPSEPDLRLEDEAFETGFSSISELLNQLAVLDKELAIEAAAAASSSTIASVTVSRAPLPSFTSHTSEILQPSSIKESIEDDGEDFLGILQATIESNDDAYEDSDTVASSSPEAQQKAISVHNLRPGKTVIILDDDSSDENESKKKSSEHMPGTSALDELAITTRQPSSSTSSTHTTKIQCRSPTVEPPDKKLHRFHEEENLLLSLPEYTSDTQEREYLSLIHDLTSNYWCELLPIGFSKVLDTLLPSAEARTKQTLELEFQRYLNQRCINPEAFSDSYSMLSAYVWRGECSMLFGFIGCCLEGAGCSESSCERIFSYSRWVIGDRRGSMKLATISRILHILCNSQLAS